MKKIIVVAIFLFLPLVTFAQWDDCPYGKTDGSCSYPGECSRYVDTNSDKVCDHSQQRPVVKKTVVNIVEKEPEILDLGEDSKNVITEKTKDEIIVNHGNTDSRTIESAEGSIVNGQAQNSNIVSEEEEKKKQRYPLLQITIVTTILYLLTYILAKRKVIKMITHKKIWNILLTISFLAMAVLSVVLIIQINSGGSFLPNLNALYWHVITGIVMMIITLFHMGWHWRYYKNLFKMNKERSETTISEFKAK